MRSELYSMRYKSILVSLSLFITLSVFAQINEKDLIKAISYGETKVVLDFIKQHGNLNFTFKSKKLSPLGFAVYQRQDAIVVLMLQSGADANYVFNGQTALMLAATTNQLKIVSVILKYGAYIDYQDEKGNTALMLAVRRGHYEVVKMLVSSGANIILTNLKYKTALDIAQKNVRENIIAFLESKFETMYLPDWKDGPYIFYEKDDQLRSIYLLRDSSKNIVTRMDITYKFFNDSVEVHDYVITGKKFQVPRDGFRRAQYEYTTDEDIFIVGDIHGKYDAVSKFLQSNNVVDSNLNWSWGKGHLVFMGDIFDRGDGVTETLWFIYKLEQQAEKAGGKVHFVYGNHEVMVLFNDLRYTTEKYKFLSSSQGLEYPGLYGKNTVLGKWLRSKNTVLKINDKLFVHAGISRALMQTGIKPDEINQFISDYLENPSDTTHSEIKDFLYSSEGPLWYRGYFMKHQDGHPDDITIIDEALNYFNVNEIIVGHTEVPAVLSMYNGKIFAINVPFGVTNIPAQGILMRHNQIFRIYNDWVVERMK